MAGCIPKASEGLAEAIEAACIQAAATQDAAFWQSIAAAVAGLLTLIAGILAVWAAVKGTSTALRGVREQIEAQQAMQVKDQHYNTKRDVYLDTAAALNSGMFAIGRLADPQVSFADALEDFRSQAPNIAKIHLVSPINVIRDVLAALQAVTSAHLKIHAFRLSRESGRLYYQYSDIDISDLNRLCLSEIASLSETYEKATVAVREDLGMDINPEEYRQLMAGVIAASNEAVRRTISNIRPHQDRKSNS